MDDHISRGGESVIPASLSTYKLLILHTAEAQEWAIYLKQILQKSSKMFRQNAVLLHTIHPTDQLHEYNFDHFVTFNCVLLLLSGAFIDLMSEPELRRALRTLLHPSHKVVALLCGVSEEDIMMADVFEDWSSWRKMHAEDEPSVYVSIILETITNSKVQAEQVNKGIAPEQLHVTGACARRDSNSDEKQEVMYERVHAGFSVTNETSAHVHIKCLTVQPTRLLTGVDHTLFIIFNEKIDELPLSEVEFSSENNSTKTVPGTVVNEYTLSLTAPDMPAGVVSLTLCLNQLRISLKCVTYYTNMGEVSRCLKNAADPINFLCQAFNLGANSIDILDNILTDSIKSKTPAPGLQMFGIRQTEEKNMEAYKRNEELPTLLHFAAKYGLKKLTSFLLQIPGALQAYNVMNKNGDYPNTLAEKSGFAALRQFIDGFIVGEDYEVMSASKSSDSPSDMYESMLDINPGCADDLYEVMITIGENPEEAMLRTFFQAKPHTSEVLDEGEQIQTIELNETDNEFDPYDLSSTDIYDTVYEDNVPVLSRPPAPIPRPEIEPEPEKPIAYISRVFSDKSMSQSQTAEYQKVHPTMEVPMPLFDPFAGMKTPGQRQLITLQERVKVGEITVDEAVREFKAWQLDHESRANSVRYQQDNLKRLRESINKRHNERDKTGKEFDYNISAPLPRNSICGATVTLECALYDGSPRMVHPTSSTAQSIQRGSWKTGSTSSTSSTESNRLSTHSNLSYSSGTDPDLEDSVENLPLMQRPSEAAPLIPPRIPPRNSQSASDKMSYKRYISSPAPAPPQRPPRHKISAPPVPRRLR
ncbi:phosphoinositide 3-kinase adapter protein 1 [Stigmatopora argus]